jgi:hypothetical protein
MKIAKVDYFTNPKVEQASVESKHKCYGTMWNLEDILLVSQPNIYIYSVKAISINKDKCWINY